MPASIEPPLNPIHPTQKNEGPGGGKDRRMAVAAPSACPPRRTCRFRGPMTMIAARATQAPTECTTVEPAKSMKPSAASQGVFLSVEKAAPPRPSARRRGRSRRRSWGGGPSSGDSR